MTDGEAREMARELVRGSIIEDAASQFIAQILKHAHEERVKPLRKQVADLETKLAKAVEALEFYSPKTIDGVAYFGGDDAGYRAVATLAELTGGQKDE